MGGFNGLSDLPGLVFSLPRKGGPIGPLFLSIRFVGSVCLFDMRRFGGFLGRGAGVIRARRVIGVTAVLARLRGISGNWPRVSG